MKRIGVVAGTPVDTKMGVDFIKSKNAESGMNSFDPIYLPAAGSCDEQVLLQYASEEEKRRRMDEIFDGEIANGSYDFFIYCNSLSGTFDFDKYSREKSREFGRVISVYTPLQVYRKRACDYRCIGVMAAHNMSSYGIEAALMSSNPDISVIGSGNIQIVRMIEAGRSPAEITEKCRLGSLLDYMQACGAEAVIFGCTHFPYLKSELEKITSLPLIDPAEEMYKMMNKVMNQ